MFQQNSHGMTKASNASASNSTSNMLNSPILGASETPVEGKARRPGDHVTGDDLLEEDVMNFAMFSGANPVTYK